MQSSPSDSWRAWLLTGSRVLPADRRRARGAYRGLKTMLIEGMHENREQSRPWTEFSGAMVRQAVNEAISKLPPDDMQILKLAYFNGLTNREIAERLGLSVGVVQRRLRRAIARISDFLEQGRAFGRRAAYAILAWLAARQVLGFEHFAGAVAVAAVTTTIALQPAAVTPAVTPARPPAVSVGVGAPSHQPATSPVSAPAASPALQAPAPAPAVRIPPLPALPSPPAIKLPRLPSL